MVNYAALIRHLEMHNGTMALLTMQATSTTSRLMKLFPERIVSLFSAEHGFFGCLKKGEKAANSWHPFWNKPIHSLYGEHRKPTQEMLEGVDRMVIDLCDIGVRSFTYLATLKNTLESCDEFGIPVTVLDRQIPLGGILDGPSRTPELSSFTAPINVPLCHAMTPAECAQWICNAEGLNVDLTTILLKSWSHKDYRPWPNFVPPSPEIKTWDSAVAYPLTIFTDAYPAIDCDKDGALAYRVVGAPWLNSNALISDLETGLETCGVAMRPYRYQASSGPYAGFTLNGVLFSVARPTAYYPVTAGALIFTALLQRYGDRVMAGARPERLDKIFGSDEFRVSLSNGNLSELFISWIEKQDAYLETRVNLYD